MKRRKLSLPAILACAVPDASTKNGTQIIQWAHISMSPNAMFSRTEVAALD